MNAKEILAELTREIGLEGTQFDENHMCRLVFDDKLAVDFENPPDQNLLLVYASAGKLPRDGREQLYKMMLEANLFGLGTGGAVLALDANLDEIILFRRYPSDDIDYDKFKQDLELFLESLEQWQDKVLTYGSAGDLETDTPAPSGSPQNGLMRV